MAITVAVSILTNIAFGFSAGIAVHYLLYLASKSRKDSKEAE